MGVARLYKYRGPMKKFITSRFRCIKTMLGPYPGEMLAMKSVWIGLKVEMGNPEMVNYLLSFSAFDSTTFKPLYPLLKF